MYNNFYLLKKVEEQESTISFATVQDSFTFLGEVVKVPAVYFEVTTKQRPTLGDKVLFLKGTGEDVEIEGQELKVVKFEDIIMKI